MTGEIGILNVGAGDTKLTFDKSNPAECIRSARIVTDMLKRGYALLVEVERNGVKAYERVREFREDTCEYIIADFDPVVADQVDRATSQAETATPEIHDEQAAATPTENRAQAKLRGRPASKTRAVHASQTTGVAVARSAGG